MFGVSDSLEMLRINASGRSAKMVNLVAVRNVTNKEFVSDPVHTPRLSFD